MQKTYVFKASEKLQKELIDFYKDNMREKKPPYSVFQANSEDTVVTLYESGKVMFQGISADIDANIWMQREKKLTGKSPETNQDKKKKKDTKKDKFETSKLKKKYYNMNTIGSDEVGTGDYFGPIVVTASYVSKDKIALLKEIGVDDSKKLTDEKILEIAPRLVREIPHATYILSNEEYNETISNVNMNQTKAILHNKALFKIKEQYPDYDEIIVDQFEVPKSYFKHISKSTNKVEDITFITKSESIVPSVAVSSIISRCVFLVELNKLSDISGFKLQKGASSIVDEQAKEIVLKHGEDMLSKIAKLNFKNTEKIKELLKK